MERKIEVETYTGMDRMQSKEYERRELSKEYENGM